MTETMHWELLLLRHATAVSSFDVASDYKRALTAHGEIEAESIARWVYAEQVAPDKVISSPAQRAKQTTELLCAELGFPTRHVQWVDGIYEASCEDLVKILTTCDAEISPILLVGHNPGLEQLVDYLLGSDCYGRVRLAPATLAHLSLTVQWPYLSAGVADLRRVVRADRLGRATR